MGVPQNGWSVMENHLKMDDLINGTPIQDTCMYVKNLI